MQLSGDRQKLNGLNSQRTNLFSKLQAAAMIALVLTGTVPGQAQNPAPAAPPAQNQAGGLPTEPAPNYTQPLYMRSTTRDYTKSRNYWPNPIGPYSPTQTPPPNFLNSLRLENLVKDGKIYLNLSDAVLLALENNFDIAIQRLNLDIADTDILRTKAGSSVLGVSSGLVTNTLGGSTSTTSGGGGPGGTTVSSGGASAGSSGLTLTANGGGPTPEAMDPTLTGKVQLQRQKSPSTNAFTGGTTNTDQYNFEYDQGFITGTALQVTFQNSRTTTSQPFTTYSPALQSTFNAQVTQHLLQGFGWGVNGRFIVQAKNDRRIADSAFRQQLLYTINQVENIYWGLVGAYEDVQAKQRALDQSNRVLSDNKKQLEIGTLAPLDVVNANSQVATDQQALIASQSTLEYQQLVMKQAIARNLDDPTLANAPVIPTDRVSSIETPEEHSSVDDLVRQAEANSPSIEQAILAVKNDEITLKGVKNGLLPTVDIYGFYGATALGGSQAPQCINSQLNPCAPNTIPTVDYSHTFQNLFNGTGPNKGAGVNVTIPIRNRTAQALQARATLEYRQAQMRLQQLYVQVRMQVTNGQYALTNDRAALQASITARDFNKRSLDDETKKLRLGASTTANVLQQERNLATAENNLISAEAAYAKDRASLSQILASTLDRYGISIADAVTGKVNAQPTIPGIEPAKASSPEAGVPEQQQQLQQEQQPAPNQQAMPPPAQPQQ